MLCLLSSALATLISKKGRGKGRDKRREEGEGRGGKRREGEGGNTGRQAVVFSSWIIPLDGDIIWL